MTALDHIAEVTQNPGSEFYSLVSTTIEYDQGTTVTLNSPVARELAEYLFDETLTTVTVVDCHTLFIEAADEHEKLLDTLVTYYHEQDLMEYGITD